MKKFYLNLVLSLVFCVSAYAQDIQTSKPIKTYYTSLLKDIEVKTTSTGEGIVLSFRDEKYQEIDEFEYIYFEDEEGMLHFFNKVEEVQMSPKTEKSVDVTLDMTEHITKIDNKQLEILRKGNQQWVTYIFYGTAYTVIPKTRLKKIIKKIKKNL